MNKTQAIAAYHATRQRPDLVALAKARNPRVTYAAGNAGSGASKRRHRCNICNTEIATDSGKWGMTKASALAVVEHLETHASEVAA